jgi:hypothetical protein
MSLTKLSLAGNNLINANQGEFGLLHPDWGGGGTGKLRTFFTVYHSIHKRLCVKGKSKSQNWLNKKNMIVLIFSVLKFFLSCIPSRELLFYRVPVICL